MSRNLSNINKIFSRSERSQHGDLADYVDQNLSKDEARAIEMAMVDDPFLSDAVEGIEVIGTEDFGDLLAELGAELDSRLDQPAGKEIPFVQTPPTTASRRKKRISGFRLTAIAAAIALLCVVGYIFMPQGSNSSFPQSHYMGYDIGDEVRSEGVQGEFDRAGQFFKQGKYKEAGKLFGQMEGEAARLLAGHSYFNLKDYKKASIYFQEVIDLGQGSVEDAQFNLALSYAGMGQEDKARQLLQTIADDGFHNYHVQAEKALEDLGK